ncbi:PUM-HD domain-containing protein [Mycena chlorophos]|uniref:PUM-HD domain-containing protein n=1 Tax=Mycena chlorophos TaxID=658473 RepID=A0A8H6RVY9_MYCCL|nr:PUM-HD domain-containing protein [Mycena chlorophos]
MSLSGSVAVLTPLDSAHPHSPIGVVGANTNNTTTLHSPIRSAHLNLNLQHQHQHQQQHYGGQTHSPTHAPSFDSSQSQLAEPPRAETQTHSLHGSPLHSPAQLLGYKDHRASDHTSQQQQQRFTYGGYREHGYGSEPPSPYGGGYGVGPTHLHNQGRYVSLPPTPPGLSGPGSHVILPPIDNAGPLHSLVHKRSIEAAYYQHQQQQQQSPDRDATDGWIRGDSADLLGLGFGGGVEANANGLGLGLGLGLGAGFAQMQAQNNTNNVGLGLGMGMGPRLGVSYGRDPGYSAGGAPNASPLNTHSRAGGSGVLGPEELNALRGSLVYHQQQQQLAAQTLLLHHQQQQHQQQQQELAVHEQEPLEVKGVVGTGSSSMSRRGSASEAVPASPGHSPGGTRDGRGGSGTNEPINFLSLLHPSSSPPYATFVSRIIKSADQQASIFLQQKLKVAGPEERARIVDAICARGAEMMMHRFGNWAVQRCLEAAADTSERRKIVACMRGRVVDLATNCYGCHVLQKALDCDEEEIRLLIVSELLVGDPAQTLVNKHASHVWSKIMELSWTPPAPPIFAYVNKSLKGKWAALACHETGSLVVQHAFENLEESAKDGIVDELLGQGPATFAEVVKSQWGAYCIQHILEHGSEKHRQMALDHLIAGLLEFATNEQGNKSVTKALKEGGKDTLDRFVKRMCEPAKGARRAMIVDLALSPTGSQLIASVLPSADKEQRAALYDCIRGHIVTLRGCKTGSKVIWLFDRMRAYYGY